MYSSCNDLRGRDSNVNKNNDIQTASYPKRDRIPNATIRMRSGVTDVAARITTRTGLAMKRERAMEEDNFGVETPNTSTEKQGTASNKIDR